MSEHTDIAAPTCNLLVIRSPNIDRAIAFYQVIGLSFSKHSHGSGPEHYTAKTGNFVFEIYPARDVSDITTATRIGFIVNCVDSTVKKLAALGTTIRSQPAHSDYGRRSVVIDLDGHTVELVSDSQNTNSQNTNSQNMNSQNTKEAG